MGSGVSTSKADQKKKKVEETETEIKTKLNSSHYNSHDVKEFLGNKDKIQANNNNVNNNDEIKNQVQTDTTTSQQHPRQSESYQEDQDNDNYSQGDNGESATFFAHTALSLGMDNDDLLFNLMFFDDGQAPTLGSMMNSVQQETLALHSSNNTPYKLKPASENAIAELKTELFDWDLLADPDQERECAVCKDEMERGCSIVRLPACSHYFHEDCLLRWINLQGWCPVCRADILPAASDDSDTHKYFHSNCEDCDCTAALSVADEADETHPPHSSSSRVVSKKLFPEEGDTEALAPHTPRSAKYEQCE